MPCCKTLIIWNCCQCGANQIIHPSAQNWSLDQSKICFPHSTHCMALYLIANLPFNTAAFPALNRYLLHRVFSQRCYCLVHNHRQLFCRHCYIYTILLCRHIVTSSGKTTIFLALQMRYFGEFSIGMRTGWRTFTATQRQQQQQHTYYVHCIRTYARHKLPSIRRLPAPTPGPYMLTGTIWTSSVYITKANNIYEYFLTHFHNAHTKRAQ